MDGVIGAHAILERLRPLGAVLAIKLYRLPLDPAPPVPILPCLDHEAMLHEGIDPHMAVYLEERQARELHELVFIPAGQRIEVDTVSTWGESSYDSRRRLMTALAVEFPGWRITVKGLSWWRGDRRVADACRAQVLLRDVLLSPDIAGINAGINRLQAVGSLMEKQGRVASWGVRTVTGPLLPAAAVITYLAMGSLSPRFGDAAVTWMRYSVVGALGAVFLYYGLKAVQLTEMSNRVWKRTAEYGLILAERKRLAASADAIPRPK